MSEKSARRSGSMGRACSAGGIVFGEIFVESGIEIREEIKKEGQEDLGEIKSYGGPPLAV